VSRVTASRRPAAGRFASRWFEFYGEMRTVLKSKRFASFLPVQYCTSFVVDRLLRTAYYPILIRGKRYTLFLDTIERIVTSRFSLRFWFAQIQPQPHFAILPPKGTMKISLSLVLAMLMMASSEAIFVRIDLMGYCF
jgi:hypothetical protein